MTEKLTYTQNGDYLIPDLRLTPIEPKPLTKYGRMRRAFLKENRPLTYNDLVLSEKLYPHLREVQKAASARMEQLMAALLEKDPAPSKEQDQMGWVQHMNSLRAQAEEIVLAELIYS